MFYYVLGMKVSSMEGENASEKVIPLTEDLFNPDVHVMNQKIIRHLYPNATNEFIKNAIAENLVSPIMLYPSLYIQDESVLSSIDPLIDFSIFSKLTTNVKHQFDSDLLFEVIGGNINEMIESGYNIIKGNQYQFQQTVKLRTIKTPENQSPKLLTCIVSWKMSLDNNMYVSIHPDKNDTIYETVMANLVYLNKADIKKIKLGFKIKIGFLDVVEDSFESLINFNPVMFDVDLSKRQNIRSLQYNENQFIANIVDAGIEKVKMSRLKKISVNRKQIKMK